MAKNAKRPSVTTSKRGGLPKPTTTSEQAGPDFLKPKHVGNGEIGATAVVEFLGEEGEILKSRFGDQVAFPVKIGKVDYLFAIKVDSGNHMRLFEQFGEDPPRGRVNVEIAEFRGNRFVAISDPE